LRSRTAFFDYQSHNYVSAGMEKLESSADRFWRWALPVAVVACLYVNYVYNANPPEGALRCSRRRATPSVSGASFFWA
jgi:hypothetical protein